MRLLNGLWGVLNLFEDDWLVSCQAAKFFFASTIYIFALTPVFLGLIDIKHLSPVDAAGS